MKNLILATILLTILLNSCFHDITTSSNPQNEMHFFKKCTLNIALKNDLTSLNYQQLEPYSYPYILEGLFSGLVKLDKDGEIIPDIAQSWQVSPDAMTFIFKINPLSKFSDGSSVLAEDVEYSFYKVLNKNSIYNYLAKELFATDSNSDPHQSLIILDDHRIEIKLRSPNPNLLHALTSNAFFIVKKGSLEHHLSYNEFPFSGAYKIKDYKPNQYIIINKNEFYYEFEKFKIPEIKFYIIPDINIQLKYFNNQIIDLISSTRDLTTTLLNQIDKQNLYTTNEDFIYLLVSNPQNSVLQSRKLKEAISLIINRQELGAQLSHKEKPLYSITPNQEDYNHTEYDWAHINYQKRLDIARYNWHEINKNMNLHNNKTTLNMIFVDNPYNSIISKHIKERIEELSNHHIMIHLVALDYQSYMNKIQTKDYDLILCNWIADYHEIGAFLKLYSCDNNPEIFSICDQSIENLIEKSYQISDKQQREEIMHQISKHILNNYNSIPIIQGTRTIVFNNNILNIQKNNKNNSALNSLKFYSFK